MKKKIFLFGRGNWALNYIRTIESDFNIKVTCIISKSGLREFHQIPILIDIKEALKIFGKPDLIIVSTKTEDNLNILNDLDKTDCKIILEKPICQLSQLRKLNLKKNIISRITVNHFHFYHESFLSFLEGIKIDHIKYFIIFDGGGYLKRSIDPLEDWGSHAFGLLYHLFSGIKFNYKKKSYKTDQFT